MVVKDGRSHGHIPGIEGVEQRITGYSLYVVGKAGCRKGLLGWTERITDVSFSGLARPPRLFPGKRKNLEIPPMRQLMGLVERRGRQLMIQVTSSQDGHVEQVIGSGRRGEEEEWR